MIDDDFLKLAGKWIVVRTCFEGVQPKGAENLILLWQLVKKDAGNSKTAKIRSCLDDTIQNKLVFRGKNKMPDVTILSIKWKFAKYFISVEALGQKRWAN